MRFEFVVRSRGEPRAVALATGDVLTFGRLKACDVQLDDESVSRRHFTLHAREDRCVIVDLQSANGTFLNDLRISTAELKPGDTLRLGSSVIEFTSALALEPPAAGPIQASLNVTGHEVGQTLVRRAVDPGKLEFLRNILEQSAVAASGELLIASAQRYISRLHKVSEELSRAAGVEDLIDAILSGVLNVTKGDRVAILMPPSDADTDSTEPDVSVVGMRTRAGTGTPDTMVLSRTVVRDVLEHGISTFTHDALTDERYVTGESAVAHRVRSTMCAPMRTSDAILGVLYVDSYTAFEFDEQEFELLAAIGNQAGIALHRARLLADMERLFVDLMKAIATMIDAKDGYTHRHSERVAAFAVKLAREMGLSASERNNAGLAGLLHDLGKIGVPDAILNKPGELTEAEFAEMRRHPGHGAQVLSSIQGARIAGLLPGVRFHHERWDGTGYPDGLEGSDVPILGRIVAVADFLDALSTERSYHAARSLEEVMTFLRAQSGTAFDPDVVAAALALHDRGELASVLRSGLS